MNLDQSEFGRKSRANFGYGDYSLPPAPDSLFGAASSSALGDEVETIILEHSVSSQIGPDISYEAYEEGISESSGNSISEPPILISPEPIGILEPEPVGPLAPEPAVRMNQWIAM